jgi:hypothetical protein
MKLSPLVTLLLSLSSAAGIEQGTPLDRLVTQAQAQAKWTDATTPPEKLNLVREAALKLDIVSAPVSDRYLITALGGPIDLVHFLGLAITVSSGAMARDDALFDQWKREGGADFEAGLSTTYPTEAHPDDLPSNALGALFGEEIRTRQKDPNFDVAAAFREFFVPLEPVPDRIAKQFSHRRIVMGLNDDATPRLVRSRSEWFTAKPLFCLYAFDRDRAVVIGDSAAALRMAGFQLRAVHGKLIAIDRIVSK